jgi:protease-4
LSLVLNILCGGALLLSCVFFGAAGLAGDPSSVPLNERTHSGKADASNKIAIITLDGVILEGLLGYAHKQIEQAAKDKAVKAVVLRINSPGGSITASDDLHRRFTELHNGNPEKKHDRRPLVVSMGSLAASGGYYVAMPADFLFAEPTTMTGSIGVYASFPNVADWGKRNGLGMETIKQGEVKTSGSPFKTMTPKERAVWQDMVNQSYNQFLQVVEDGREDLRHDKDSPRDQWPLLRRFPWEPADAGPDDLDKDASQRLLVHLALGMGPLPPDPAFSRYLADGGIYTAADAKRLHLVDQIGTLDDAVKKARELAKIDNARAVQYDKPRTISETLFGIRSPRPGVFLEPGLARNALTPRLWYLAPGCDLAGLVAAVDPD